MQHVEETSTMTAAGPDLQSTILSDQPETSKFTGSRQHRQANDGRPSTIELNISVTKEQSHEKSRRPF